MKLIELISRIDEVDEESIIFMEDTGKFDSDVILSHAEEGDAGIKKIEGREYYYLIEVFLAKEFIEDWVGGIKYKPTSRQVAKRLHQYAINDA